MASRPKTSRAQSVRSEYEPSPVLRLVWILLIAVWGVAAAALASFDIADPPSHAVAPLNADPANLIGAFGAAFAYHAFSMLGVGAWIVLLSLGWFLVCAGRRRPIGHPALRLLGVVLLGLALSGMHALVLPTATVFPEGAGGLIAVVGVAELTARLGALGTAVALLGLAAIGATVAFDRWLIVVPELLAGVYERSAERVRGALALVSERVEERRKRALERANDIDDDERLRRVEQAVKTAAKRTKKMKLNEPVALDEDAGGLGGAADFDVDEAVVGAQDEEYEYEDEEAEARGSVDDEEEVDDDDMPGAPQVFDADALKDKISKLPIRFAGKSVSKASDEDLDALRAQRKSEEEADKSYKFPGLDLLEDPEENYNAEMEQYVREQAEALEQALTTYKIDGEVVSIESGPVITLYQVALAPGTKVSSVQSVSSDIARMLRAVNVRIVSNTEGLDTIGIEVPNQKKEKVRLKELMAGNEKAAKMKLPLFLGKDASGTPLVTDLASLPHMLIAGTTGSGKSVCMNAIIMGFLYTQKPSDLKLVLVDPKMVELSQFKDIPHLMCPVVTDMGKAAAILEWAVTKMDERYELLAEAGCRDITAYNGLGWEELRERLNPKTEIEEAKIPRKLPYMVFIIDELADLMMTNKEVESSIVRIAQKARAVGIHLILATQRPQANVVTGLIKSNMPGRLAFKVASGMDSRIVLDQKGGELLLGQGDMLMITPRSSASMRAQGTLVDDSEIRNVVRFLRDNANSSFEGSLVRLGDHGFNPASEQHEENMRKAAQEDPLFDRAVELVLETRRGSVSMLQRRLAIGYTRSARLIEMMGEAGIIGEHKGTVAREVTLTLEEWHAMKELAANPEGESNTTEDEGGLFAHVGDDAGETPMDQEEYLTDKELDEARGEAVEEPASEGAESMVEAKDDAAPPPFHANAAYDEADAPESAVDEAEGDEEYEEDEDESAEFEEGDYEDEQEEEDDNPEATAGDGEEADKNEESEEYEYVDVDDEGNPIEQEDDEEYEYEYEYVDEEEDETKPA